MDGRLPGQGEIGAAGDSFMDLLGGRSRSSRSKLGSACKAVSWSGRGRLRQCFAVVRGFAVGAVVV